MARKRHLSRIAVMQVLFERERHSAFDLERSFRQNITELGETDETFARTLLDGVLKHEEVLRRAIQDHAPGWTLERMDPIARTVLHIGAEELLFSHDAPPAVVMDEAIEIAKEFGTDESGKFVNGVLNAMAKKK